MIVKDTTRKAPQLRWFAEHPYLRHEGQAARYSLEVQPEVNNSCGAYWDRVTPTFNGEPISLERLFFSEAIKVCENHLLGTLAVNPLTKEPTEPGEDPRD